MRTINTAISALMLTAYSLLAACGPGQERSDENVQLRSGTRVPILAITRPTFSNGDTVAVQIVYRTSYSTRDTALLREEAHQVWAAVGRRVSVQGITAIIITAQSTRTRVDVGPWLEVQKSYTFVARRSKAGAWYFRGDPQPLEIDS